MWMDRACRTKYKVIKNTFWDFTRTLDNSYVRVFLKPKTFTYTSSLKINLPNFENKVTLVF